MDKILGEVFDEYVDKQIKTRQNSLGKSQKSPDDLVVFNSSTPWIRLSSSIEVDKDRAKTLAINLGINQSEIVGRNLAKNLVLFAGTSDGANLSNRKGGVGYGLESSYGFLSDEKQGYRPMPGITNISATYKNNGTLKQAQVNLTCFTRKQFEAIEAIYLRLGYTMVLEWGHSIYFNNKGKKESMSSLKIPNILFRENLPDPNDAGEAAVQEALKKNPNLTNNQKDAIYYEVERKVRKQNEIKADYPTRLRAALQENKEETGGNYDAMVAKVSNFSWSLNDDLSYSITLDLVSVGDIIDSLKMNIGGTNITSTNTPQIQTDPGLQNLLAIELASGASAFNSFLFELIQVDEKTIQEETDEATQRKLALRDRIRNTIPYAKKIQEVYPDILEALKARYITPFDEVIKLLKGKTITITQKTFGLAVTFEGILDSDTKTQLLANLKNGRFNESFKNLTFIQTDANGNESIIGLSRNIRLFLNSFNLDVDVKQQPTPQQPTVTGTIVTGLPEREGELSKQVRGLRTRLNKLDAQLSSVVIKASSTDPDKDNLDLLEYLNRQAEAGGNFAKNAVIRGLTTGFWDKDQTLKADSLEEDQIISGLAPIQDFFINLLKV